MKIMIVSDIHNEYNLEKNVQLPNNLYYGNDIDVLIIAGDLDSYPEVIDTLRDICDTIYPIKLVFVAGNHDYYCYNKKESYEEINKKIKKIEEDFPNFHFLLNDSVNIDGVDFYGGTMWSPNSLPFEANDSKYIHFDNKKTSVDDFKIIHNEFIKGLNDFVSLNSECKKVVVSHFVPSMSLKNPFFNGKTKEDYILNNYFHVDLEQFITSSNLDLWVYGHNHYSDQRIMGNTMVISCQECDSRTEVNKVNYGFKTIEI